MTSSQAATKRNRVSQPVSSEAVRPTLLNEGALTGVSFLPQRHKTFFLDFSQFDDTSLETPETRFGANATPGTRFMSANQFVDGNDLFKKKHDNVPWRMRFSKQASASGKKKKWRNVFLDQSKFNDCWRLEHAWYDPINLWMGTIFFFGICKSSWLHFEKFNDVGNSKTGLFFFSTIGKLLLPSSLSATWWHILGKSPKHVSTRTQHLEHAWWEPINFSYEDPESGGGGKNRLRKDSFFSWTFPNLMTHPKKQHLEHAWWEPINFSVCVDDCVAWNQL